MQFDRDALYMYSVEEPVPAAARGSPLKEDLKAPPPPPYVRTPNEWSPVPRDKGREEMEGRWIRETR